MCCWVCLRSCMYELSGSLSWSPVLPKSHFLKKNSFGDCSPLYLPRQRSNKLGWSKLTFNATSVQLLKIQLQHHKEVADHCKNYYKPGRKRFMHSQLSGSTPFACMATGMQAYAWKWGLNISQVFHRQQLLLSKRSSFYCPFPYKASFYPILSSFCK